MSATAGADTPTVHCRRCQRPLAWLLAGGALNFGPATVHAPRKVQVECPCGHRFWWYSPQKHIDKPAGIDQIDT